MTADLFTRRVSGLAPYGPAHSGPYSARSTKGRFHMTVKNIVQAWRDPLFRSGLSATERAMLPDNPAGMIELHGTALDAVAGASGATGTGSGSSKSSKSTGSTGSASCGCDQGTDITTVLGVAGL